MFSIDSFFIYFGIDWIGAFMLFMSMYLLGDGKRTGFFFGILGCLLMLVFSILAGSLGSFVLNVVLSGLNLRGYLRWNKVKNQSS